MEQQTISSRDRFTRSIDVIRRCVAALEERAGGVSVVEHELLARSFAELQTALEERRTAQVELEQELVRYAAMAIDDARRHHRRSEIALALQAGLLPADLPEIPGVDVAACYRPAGEDVAVGGDFFDLFETDDGAWAILIGDVSGKGSAAAGVTPLARYTVRAVAMRERQPKRVLEALNEAFLRQRAGKEFCTAAFGRLEPAFVTGRVGDGASGRQSRSRRFAPSPRPPVAPSPKGARLTIARGGHPPPLLLRADGTVQKVGSPGQLLGGFPSPRLTEQAVELRPGDGVVLYTDGVTEARNSHEVFGEERLAALLSACAGLGAARIVDRIERAVVGFQGGVPLDDIATLVLRLQ
jgi:serine phosphatase RsbU (regulator of sigma subunit)